MDNLSLFWSHISKFFPNLPPSGFSDWITLVIFVTLLFGFFGYLHKVKKQHSKAKNSIKFYESFLDFVEKEKEHLADKRRELLEKVKEHKDEELSAIWQEFDESLVEIQISENKRKLLGLT
ncbi:hypothetical protein BKK52_07975 [Rodentibacter trehalosifermentans]|uniref:Uncharacterized protein n=1 Tax=Rodentibacter trehalosifermentans TaxID=1908263 RepID=A0A1V3J036_9PAST|nr:hypothetical protein [Rodentibacter trehalosifermentans]OOF47793.1 hypothetical protein BKK52_07975 [Rodentibacter trehalosifermentans]